MHKKAKFTDVTGIQEEEWNSFLSWLSGIQHLYNVRTLTRCSEKVVNEVEFFGTIRRRVEAQEFETNSLACAIIAFHLGVLEGSLTDILDSESIISNTGVILEQLKRN